jgi:hypothetical protein
MITTWYFLKKEKHAAKIPPKRMGIRAKFAITHIDLTENISFFCERTRQARYRGRTKAPFIFRQAVIQATERESFSILSSAGGSGYTVVDTL